MPKVKEEKTTIVYQEKYKKGVFLNKEEVKRMIDENIDKMSMEMRERKKYSDGTEGLVLEIRY